jgi:uncharacterized protein (TIGR02466 family)
MNISTIINNLLYLVRSSNFPEAAKLADSISHLNIKDAKFLHASGIAYLQLGKIEQAHQQLSQFIHIVKHQHGIINVVADLRSKIGQTGADALFLESIQLSPNTPQYHYNYALHLSRNGKLKSSVEQLKKTIEINARFQAAYREVIRLLLTLNDNNLALKYLVQYTSAIDTKDIKYYLLAASVYESLNEHQQAIDHFQRVINTDKNHISAYIGVIHNHIFAGNIDTALDWCKQSLDLFPLNQAIHNLYCNLAFETGKQEPLRRLQKAIETTNSDELTSLYIAKCLLINKIDKANSALKHFSNTYQDKDNFLTSLVEVKKYEKDFQFIIDQLAHVDPLSNRLKENKVEANLALGRSDNAIDDIHFLMDSDTSNQYYKALYLTYLKLQNDSQYTDTYHPCKLVQTANLVEQTPDYEPFQLRLKARLKQDHVMNNNPLNQSVRGGTQTPGNLLTRVDIPEIKQLNEQLTHNIHKRLSALYAQSSSANTLSEQYTGNFKFVSSWSIWLESDGYHIPHCHTKGWYSGVYYVDVPDNINQGNDEGSLFFGKPGITLKDEMSPDFVINPKSGDLVLFPSMIWHGTQPFKTKKPRIVIAFDIVPV